MCLATDTTSSSTGYKREGGAAWRYARLFRAGDDGRPPPGALTELAEAMASDVALTRSRDDSRIPAGYTYLGHLLAHELTFDGTKGLPVDSVEAEALENNCTPFIDLRSVYGHGPGSVDRSLYQSDGVRLKLGAVEGPEGTRWNDLPRLGSGTAILADERNDENLATAQTLVAILKFHNKTADFLEARNLGRKASLEEVRSYVVSHFQSIILHDLLWRLVPDATYHDVLRNGRKLFYPDGLKSGESPRIPVEFSHAAFRFGHSMVKSSYRWSEHRQNVSFSELFEQTGRNSSRGFKSLGEDWVVDWRNFYDFSALEGCERRKEINFSRKIDTRITRHLAKLPSGERRHGEPPNLAARDLLRGYWLNLPSGQQAARQCHRDHGIYVGCLTAREFAGLRDGATRSVLNRHALHEHTPLWFYILAESEVEQNGECLGRLGGRIVMEVLHGLIEFSEHSILSDMRWQPTLPAARGDMFSMPDLLHFVGGIGRA